MKTCDNKLIGGGVQLCQQKRCITANACDPPFAADISHFLPCIFQEMEYHEGGSKICDNKLAACNNASIRGMSSDNEHILFLAVLC